MTFSTFEGVSFHLLCNPLPQNLGRVTVIRENRKVKISVATINTARFFIRVAAIDRPFEDLSIAAILIKNRAILIVAIKNPV